MADVTINQLPDLAVSGGNFLAHTNGITTGRATIDQLRGGTIPAGVIVMWSGSIASIPSGWALCNGSNGTPDLRNQFIIGASVDVSGQSQTGVTGANTKTGGTKDAIVVSHSHTATSTVSDPGHTHPMGYYRGGGGGLALPQNPTNGNNGVPNIPTLNSGTGISVSTTINSQGSSGTNQNLPPYFALAYIMKL